MRSRLREAIRWVAEALRFLAGREVEEAKEAIPEAKIEPLMGIWRAWQQCEAHQWGDRSKVGQ